MLEKVNGRPAAVGVRWMCRRQGTVRWPLSAGACSPGLLGLTLLWRNSSVPPGTLPAAACHHRCGKVFIQQFPENGGLLENVPGAQDVAARPVWLGGADRPRRAGGPGGAWDAGAPRTFL